VPSRSKLATPLDSCLTLGCVRRGLPGRSGRNCAIVFKIDAFDSHSCPSICCSVLALRVMTRPAACALAETMRHALQLVSSWVENHILPYAALLSVLLVLRNFFSLMQLVFLFTSTASSTLHLQALIAAPQERKLFKVVDVLLIVTMNIWALSFLGVPDAAAWRAIHFRLPAQTLTVRCCEGDCPLSILAEQQTCA
jgi:hypothetical protein